MQRWRGDPADTTWAAMWVALRGIRVVCSVPVSNGADHLRPGMTAGGLRDCRRSIQSTTTKHCASSGRMKCIEKVYLLLLMPSYCTSTKSRGRTRPTTQHTRTYTYIHMHLKGQPPSCIANAMPTNQPHAIPKYQPQRKIRRHHPGRMHF